MTLPLKQEQSLEALARIWVSDGQDRILEVLKVPDSTEGATAAEYLLNTSEIAMLRAELAHYDELRVLSEENVSADDLAHNSITLFGPTILGEADLYIDCGGFVAMANDPTRPRA